MLTELGDLHAAGVLTDAEFQAKKATFLGSTQTDSNDVASPSVRAAGLEMDGAAASATR
jgi:hypothetical protein